MYHMTPTRNVESILANGLSPRARVSRNFAYAELRTYLWLELDSRAIDSTLGQMFDENGFEPYTMLQVDCDVTLTNDECMAGKVAAYTTEYIPPESISIIGDALNFA